MTESVAVAISSFQSDEAVISLLRSVFSTPHSAVRHVFVVDSLGSGRIATAIEESRWDVHYENSPANLGSAGNLARRMELASNAGAAWCLCLNHDADWDRERLTAMLATAQSQPRVGAVYPVLNHSPRERPWEDGRRSFVPSTGRRLAQRPTGTTDRNVLWSSSNGALYSTKPRSEGIDIFDNLWMGYEDLAYGISLHRGEWHQLMCRDAVLSNAFDYVSRRVLWKRVYVPGKPAWYSYYDIRNLIIIRRRFGPRGVRFTAVCGKLSMSIVRIALLEPGKMMRFGLLCSGIFDGLRGRDGKGKRP